MFIFRLTKESLAKVEHIDWKELVPGSSRRANVIFSADNCAFLVEKELRNNNAEFTLVDKRPKITASWPSEIIKPEVKTWLMSHQKKGIAFALSQLGTLLHHPPGAGKSASAIVWASYDTDGRCLWITRAISKFQHQKEIERLTNCKTQILDGAGPSALTLKVYKSKRRLAKELSISLTGESDTVVKTDAQGEIVFKAGVLPDGAYKLDLGTFGHGVTTPIWIRKGVETHLTINLHQDIDNNCQPTVESFSTPVINPDAKFIIINWEIIVPWLPTLLASDFTSVVFDEIHKAKASARFVAVYGKNNPDTVKFAPKKNISWAAAEISKKATRRLGLTATPVKNRVCDLWSQLDLLVPGGFGSRANWMKRYADRHVGTYGQIDDNGASNLDELRSRMRLMTHSVSIRETHKYLPPLRRETITIPISELADVAERSLAASLAGIGPIEARLMASAARKRNAALELIQECVDAKQHVTLFTGRRADAKDLAEVVKKKLGHNSGVPIAMIHGGVDMKTREALRHVYMNTPSAAVLIATGDSMGEAIDLNRTDRAIFSMLPYTWTQLEHWEKRFWRLGQDRPVIITYLIAPGTIDDRIAALLLSKLPPVEKLAPNDDLGDMRRSIMGGKSDKEIESDLMSMILGGAGTENFEEGMA